MADVEQVQDLLFAYCTMRTRYLDGCVGTCCTHRVRNWKTATLAPGSGSDRMIVDSIVAFSKYILLIHAAAIQKKRKERTRLPMTLYSLTLYPSGPDQTLVGFAVLLFRCSLSQAAVQISRQIVI